MGDATSESLTVGEVARRSGVAASALRFGALGAGLGWAVAGWFDFSIVVGIAVGAVAGYLIANVLLYQYGGRSTR